MTMSDWLATFIERMFGPSQVIMRSTYGDVQKAGMWAIKFVSSIMQDLLPSDLTKLKRWHRPS